MKILNLYAGIGGNRKLWGDEHEVTAVEFEPYIAEAYKKMYPNDTVIIADAPSNNTVGRKGTNRMIVFLKSLYT